MSRLAQVFANAKVLDTIREDNQLHNRGLAELYTNVVPPRDKLIQQADLLRTIVTAGARQTDPNQIAASMQSALTAALALRDSGFARMAATLQKPISNAGDFMDSIVNTLSKKVTGNPFTGKFQDNLRELADISDRIATERYEREWNQVAHDFKLEGKARLMQPPNTPPAGTRNTTKEGLPIIYGAQRSVMGPNGVYVPDPNGDLHWQWWPDRPPAQR
jgi:hypothetical protein